MKPNLFIVGAPKCGTTAWYEYLRTHPDICFSDVKEPHYFCTDFPNYRPAITQAEYLGMFDRSSGAKIVGEASPRYLISKVAAKNIHEFNPEAKIIIFLRNQEECLPSLHHQMLYTCAETIEDFERAWQLSGQRDSSTISRSCPDPKFLDYKVAGRFDEQVERYYARFPGDQIRVFHFDQWVHNPRDIYLEILRFVGLEDDGRTNFTPINEAKHHKIERIARWMKLPPWPFRTLVGLAKQLTSQALRRRVTRWIWEINQVRGYSTSKPSPAVVGEIRRYYAKGNALLQRRIWSSETLAHPAIGRNSTKRSPKLSRSATGGGA